MRRLVLETAYSLSSVDQTGLGSLWLHAGKQLWRAIGKNSGYLEQQLFFKASKQKVLVITFLSYISM